MDNQSADKLMVELKAYIHSELEQVIRKVLSELNVKPPTIPVGSVKAEVAKLEGKAPEAKQKEPEVAKQTCTRKIEKGKRVKDSNGQPVFCGKPVLKGSLFCKKCSETPEEAEERKKKEKARRDEKKKKDEAEKALATATTSSVAPTTTSTVPQSELDDEENALEEEVKTEVVVSQTTQEQLAKLLSEY